MNDKRKTYPAKNHDGRTIQVTIPQAPKPEELLDDAIRENLSPEAIAVIAAYLQPAKCKDPAVARQVYWFYQRLVGLLGDKEFSRLMDEQCV